MACIHSWVTGRALRGGAAEESLDDVNQQILISRRYLVMRHVGSRAPLMECVCIDISTPFSPVPYGSLP